MRHRDNKEAGDLPLLTWALYFIETQSTGVLPKREGAMSRHTVCR